MPLSGRAGAQRPRQRGQGPRTAAAIESLPVLDIPGKEGKQFGIPAAQVGDAVRDLLVEIQAGLRNSDGSFKLPEGDPCVTRV